MNAVEQLTGFFGREHRGLAFFHDIFEVAQRMAGHSNTKPAGLYDRHNGDISVGGNREDWDLKRYIIN
jgi:hypothetical protein